MLGSLELLVEEPPLRELLAWYGDLRAAKPDAAWHDRRAELPHVDAAALSRLHGDLMAFGWIDVRIAPDALETPGEIRSAYQITREGIRALRQTENQFGVLSYLPSGALTEGSEEDDLENAA
ncbi:MAG TPA: hypothetical protein VNC50_16385 [Planctomycetia bacterium]|nr:hypothetical protein [Planctomycetia bacterium]